MSRAADPVDQARRAFNRGVAAYQRMARALTKIIQRLEQGGGLSPADEKILAQHQKALMMVLSFELQIFKRGKFRTAASGAGLDLDAARAEVAGRLSRLAGPA